MPDDPNRNLEEQLTAWARKRREDAGAPLELHPATRKLLQDEVARTFPRKPAEPSATTAGWWRMLWPRFALAGSICVALVVMVGILLPSLAKSKSRGQQIALVREQNKDLSADAGRRDTPAQIAPDSAAVQAPVPPSRDESGKTRLAEAQPPAAPSLAENKLIEQQVRVQTELQDERLKAEQPAKVQTPPVSEIQMSDKAKAAAPVTAPTARELYAEKENNQVRLRQRAAPGQAAGGVSNSTSALTIAEQLPATSRTAPAEAPQLALDGVNLRQPAGGGARGFAGGTPSNQAPPATLAFNRPQKAGPADDLSIESQQAGRVVTRNVESLTARSEFDRFGTGKVSYFAKGPSSPGSQRFAQMREYRVNFNSPPMPNVLSSFQLVQNGRQIRVVDTDGSIYDGAIEQTEDAARRGIAPAAELKKNTEPELKRAVAATAEEALATQNAFFRVAGTNITLNQLVVFEGNFLANSNQANEIVAGIGLKADQSAAAVRQRLSQKGQEASGTLIRGQATIGSSNRIEVNATLVPQ